MNPAATTPAGAGVIIATLAIGRSRLLGHACRVGVDGPWFPGTGTRTSAILAASGDRESDELARGLAEAADLAELIASAVRAEGGDAVRVRAEHYLRPASLRLEHGRHDPDAFLDLWLDRPALRREVLDPAVARGSVISALRDPVTGRATRDAPTPVSAEGVIVVDGGFLVGAGLPFDLTVHLRVSAAALDRRTPPDLAWTAPAYERHRDEADPAGRAEVVVLADDPLRPAIALAPDRGP